MNERVVPSRVVKVLLDPIHPRSDLDLAGAGPERNSFCESFNII